MDFNEEKEKIILFYKNCFGEKWSSKIKVEDFGKPKSLLKPEYIFKEMKEELIIEAYKNCFGLNSVEAISYFFLHELQERPSSNYVILHDGKEMASWGCNTFSNALLANKPFMIFKEGLISAFRYRYESGKKYDTLTGTCFMTRNRGNNLLVTLNRQDILFVFYLCGLFPHMQVSLDPPYRDFVDFRFRPVELALKR